MVSISMQQAKMMLEVLKRDAEKSNSPVAFNMAQILEKKIKEQEADFTL